jgi:hypothetical protein
VVRRIGRLVVRLGVAADVAAAGVGSVPLAVVAVPAVPAAPPPGRPGAVAVVGARGRGRVDAAGEIAPEEVRERGGPPDRAHGRRSGSLVARGGAGGAEAGAGVVMVRVRAVVVGVGRRAGGAGVRRGRRPSGGGSIVAAVAPRGAGVRGGSRSRVVHEGAPGRGIRVTRVRGRRGVPRVRSSGHERDVGVLVVVLAALAREVDRLGRRDAAEGDHASDAVRAGSDEGGRGRGGERAAGVGERGGDRARDRGRGEDGSAGLGQRFARARSRRFPGGRAEARRAGAGRGARVPGRGDERVVAAADARDPGGKGAGTADRAGSDGAHLDVIVADLMMATTEAAGDGAARAVPDDRDRERRRTRARLTVRAGSNDGRRERGLHPRPDPEAEAPASVPPRARANAAGAGAPIFRRAEHQQLTRTAR